MQRWLPEPLAVEALGAGTFQPAPLAATTTTAGRTTAFRPEIGFAAADSLLSALSRDERTQVVALLEQDLRREYEQHHAEESAARTAAAEASQETAARELAAFQSNLAIQIRQEVETTLADLARRLGEIAVLMAAKVVRREVATDPQILVRALETVLFKAEAGSQLTVTLHPEDADWLQSNPAFLAQLRIGAVKTDRRLERGGCLVQSDQVEWDATVERQLAVLQEMLDETLALPSGTGEPVEDGHA